MKPNQNDVLDLLRSIHDTVESTEAKLNEIQENLQRSMRRLGRRVTNLERESVYKGNGHHTGDQTN